MAHACNPPALWGAKAGGSFEARSLRPAWPTQQNSFFTENTKISQACWQACNPSYLGGWDRRITWTQEVEFAVSQDRATALPHRLSQNKQTDKKPGTLAVGNKNAKTQYWSQNIWEINILWTGKMDKDVHTECWRHKAQPAELQLRPRECLECIK